MEFNSSNFNNVNESMSIPDSAAVKTVKVVAYVLIITMSLAGNGLVISVIYKDKRNTNTNRFIVNMCTSDIVLTLWVFPERITYILFNQWLVDGDLGNFLCKMVAMIQDVSAGVSIYSMTVIAFDRFFAIVLPFRAHIITTKRCYILISCTWMMAIALHFHYLLFQQVIWIDSSVLACRQIFPPNLEPKTFFLTQFALVFAFPLISISVFYASVLCELNRNFVDQNAEQQRIRQRENRKVSFMLITVVILFIVSWAPMLCLGFIYFFGDIKKVKIPLDTFRFLADFMVHSNAAQNAVIYFTFNKRFKQGLKNIFTSARHQRPGESMNGSNAPTKRWNVRLINGKREEDTKEERLELTGKCNGI